MIAYLWKRIIFWLRADRIGPDMPLTNWMLYFKPTMIKLCKRKFMFFSSNAEFRPGAIAFGCSKITLGQNVVIRPGCMLFADPLSETPSIIIEDNAMLGSGVHIYVSNHRFDNVNLPIIDQGHYSSKPVTVGNGAWVGANCILLPGVVVGSNSVIGAGSIVTKSIPSCCVAAGNPARIIKHLT